MGVLSFGFGICFGFYIRNTPFGSLLSNRLFAIYKKLINEDLGECKLVLVVRDDLNMSKGKIAAQCSHASVLAYKSSMLYDEENTKLWEAYSQAKVVLKTTSEKKLLELYNEAKNQGINASIVCDSGRTQVAPGSKTVIAIGPGPSSLVNKITGHLKLL